MTEEDRNQKDEQPGAIEASRVVPEQTDTTEQKTARSAGEEERTRAELRGAELRSEVAITDARRAEEETAKAREEVQAATKEERERERAEQQAKQRAKAVETQTARERAGAAHDAPATPASSVSGANVALPDVGMHTDPGAAASAARGASASRPGGQPALSRASGVAADRPEVLVGAAFAGAFVFAQILKRLVD